MVRIIERVDGVVRSTGVVGALVEYVERNRACLDPGAELAFGLAGRGEEGERKEARRSQILGVVQLESLVGGGVGLVAGRLLASSVENRHGVQIRPFTRRELCAVLDLRE